MVELGTKLRELRREQNWTQSQVAQRTGRTASVVSAYENGIRQPSYEVLIKLARLYITSPQITFWASAAGARRTANISSVSTD